MTDMDAGAARPLTDAEFAAALAAFAPFEARPALAAAVSGGRDSMALALLAADWAAARAGSFVALTVDHRLRPESAEEGRRVADWLADRGIAHRVLVWNGPHPQTGVQAAARAARYRLLEEYCAAHGILHLLLGHQRDDQLETWRMRRKRQPRGIGLAGMPALREMPMLRLLRPLLAFPRERLAATLVARRQEWIDDPSNVDVKYERVRLRGTVCPKTEVEAGLAEAAASRCALEAAVARAAARCVTVQPAGWLRIDAAAFSARSDTVRRSLLARCVTTIGGKVYPPRGARLDRLVVDIAAGRLGRGRTLGGCRIVPEARTGGRRLLVVREAPSVDAAIDLGPNLRVCWDGRFEVRTGARVPAGLRLAALGHEGWRQVAGNLAPQQRARIPTPVRTSLPAVWRGHEVFALPLVENHGKTGVRIVFAPETALSDAGFVAAAV